MKTYLTFAETKTVTCKYRITWSWDDILSTALEALELRPDCQYQLSCTVAGGDPVVLDRSAPRPLSRIQSLTLTGLAVTNIGIPANAPPLDTFYASLDEYRRLPERLGWGATGEVWKGVEVATGKHVAMKQINGVNEEHYNREVQIAASFCHETLLAVLRCTPVSDGSATIITPHMENGSLQKVLDLVHRDQAPDWWTPTAQMKILQGIAVGGRILHSGRVIHRDLKPGNVLLDENHEPKISDFDLSKLVQRERSDANTGGDLGTPGYQAPEIAEGKPYDFKVDVYSFGHIIRAVWTGEPPFRGLNQWQMYRAMKGGLLPQFPADAPPLLVQLAHDCWLENPKERPTFADVADRLGDPELLRSIPGLSVDEFRAYRQRIMTAENGGLRPVLSESRSVISMARTLPAMPLVARSKEASPMVSFTEPPGDSDAANQEISALGDESAQLRASLSSVNQELSLRVNECERLRAEIESLNRALRESRNECNGLRDRLDSADQNLASSQHRNNRIAQLSQALLDERNRLQGDLNVANRQLGDRGRECERLRNELDSVKDTVASVQVERHQLMEYLDGATAQHVNLCAELDSVTTALRMSSDEADERLQHLNEKIEKCERLQTELNLMKPGLDSQAAECAQLRASLDSAIQQLSDKSRESERLRSELASVNETSASMAAERHQLREQLNTSKAQYANLRRQFDSVETTLRSNSGSRDEMPQRLNAKLEECERLKASLGTQRANADRVASQLRDKAGACDKLQVSLQAAHKELSSQRATIEQFTSKLQHKKAKCHALKDDLNATKRNLAETQAQAGHCAAQSHGLRSKRCRTVAIAHERCVTAQSVCQVESRGVGGRVFARAAASRAEVTAAAYIQFDSDSEEYEYE
jgi:serine/threonine protein kinase